MFFESPNIDKKWERAVILYRQGTVQKLRPPLWLRCTINIYRILQYCLNYNVLINNFNNYRSNSIICDELKQKNLHTLSNYWINFPAKNSTWRTGAIVPRRFLLGTFDLSIIYFLFICFTHNKIPQSNFSFQIFSLENIYLVMHAFFGISLKINFLINLYKKEQLFLASG